MPEHLASDVALSFSPEAVHLQRRVDDEWRETAHVRFDGDDLRAGLADLRAELQAQADGAGPVLLIIPDDQLLYTRLQVTAKGPAEMPETVAEALEGLTPYSADELAFDWLFSSTEGEVHVAAVAKQTLTEASAFATRHGFSIRGFVADPDPERFPGEPSFTLHDGAHHMADDKTTAYEARVSASLSRLRALTAAQGHAPDAVKAAQLAGDTAKDPAAAGGMQTQDADIAAAARDTGDAAPSAAGTPIVQANAGAAGETAQPTKTKAVCDDGPFITPVPPSIPYPAVATPQKSGDKISKAIHSALDVVAAETATADQPSASGETAPAAAVSAGNRAPLIATPKAGPKRATATGGAKPNVADLGGQGGAVIVRHDTTLDGAADDALSARFRRGLRKVYTGRHGTLATLVTLLLVALFGLALFGQPGAEKQPLEVATITDSGTQTPAEAPTESAPPIADRTDAGMDAADPAVNAALVDQPAQNTAQNDPALTADQVKATDDDALGAALRQALEYVETAPDEVLEAEQLAQMAGAAGPAVADTAPDGQAPDAQAETPPAAEVATAISQQALGTDISDQAHDAAHDAAIPSAVVGQAEFAADAVQPQERPSLAPTASAPVESAEPAPARPVAPIAVRPVSKPQHAAAGPAPAAPRLQPDTQSTTQATRAARPPAAPDATRSQTTDAAPAGPAAGANPAPTQVARPATRPQTRPAMTAPAAAPAPTASPTQSDAVLPRSTRPPTRPVRAGALPRSDHSASRMARTEIAATPPVMDRAAFFIPVRLVQFDLPAKERGPRFAQARPNPKPGTSATIIDAAISEVVGGANIPPPPARPAEAASTVPMAAASSAPAGAVTRRPVQRPNRAASAPSGAIDSALELALRSQDNAQPAAQGSAAPVMLASSPLPPRRSASFVASTGTAAAPGVAAAPPVTPTPDPTAATAAAAQANQNAAAEAERHRADALQAQAEARIRARADADSQAEARARAEAEMRARAQAAAEEKAARAHSGNYRPAELDNEPEVANAEAGTNSQMVAQNATIAGGLNPNRTTLIGIVGAGKASRGLIRLRNGKIVTVRMGDRIDGGPITAIGDGSVTYTVSGRPRELRILDGR